MKKKILSTLTTIAMLATMSVASVASAKEYTVVYDNFALCDFEAGGYGTWDPNNALEVYTDREGNEAAQHGHSALYFAGDTGSGAKLSIWGGTTTSTNGLTPAAGDLIGGSYWLKTMQDKPYAGWKQPYVCLKAKRNGVDVILAEPKDYNSYSIWSQAPYAWTKLELVSTGKAYEAGDALTFAIESPDKYPFMIDNIQYSTTRQAKQITPIPEYTKYSAFDRLNFEDPSKLDGGVWCSGQGTDSAALKFKTNDSAYPAAEGNTAILLDGKKGGFSIWGSGVVPAGIDNANVVGSFMFKLMQPLYDAEESLANGKTWYKTLNIKVSRKSDSVVVAQFTPDDISVVDAGAYTWCQLPISSTGETVVPGDILNFEITNVGGSGIEFMIDDIEFGGISAEVPTTYTLKDYGEINKAESRVGLYYQVQVSKVDDTLTLTIGEDDCTITDLGSFDVTTALTYAILGSRAATMPITTDIKVSSGATVYEAK